MGNFQSCAGLIVKGERTFFVDVSLGREDTGLLLDSERPDVAVATHYHVDHVHWFGQASEVEGLDLYAPEGEAEALTDIDNFVARTAGAYGLGDLWHEMLVNQVGFKAVESVRPYTADSDLFNDGQIRIEAIATPGHSPGHTSIYLPEDRVLFCGDMGLDRFGPWYGWEDCDLLTLVESMLRLKELPVDLLLTSHGGICRENIDQLWRTGLEMIGAREKKIDLALLSGMSKAQILEEGVFYPNKSKLKGAMRTLIEVIDEAIYEKHLKILQAGGLGAAVPDAFGL